MTGPDGAGSKPRHGVVGMNLRDFKAIELAKLARIRDELLRKYPDRRSEVESVTERIAMSIMGLRLYTMSSFIYALMEYSKEYPELRELIPDEKTVEELIKHGEE